MPLCTLDWSPLASSAWDQRFKTIRRSTLLQHLSYAKADRLVNQLGARRGVIKIDGVEAGLVQLGEVGLVRNLIHVVNLDRGPLWFEGFGTREQVEDFFRVFANTYPRRFGRKIRILPEVEDSGANRELLARAGLRRNDRFQGYETIWVDLSLPVDRLRARLDGNWRRFLGKSEKVDLVVREDWTGDSAAAFLAIYARDRAAKNYSGPSTKMLSALLQVMVPREEAVLLTAEYAGTVVAGLLILLHGASATYQVGFNLAEGRKVWAHHRLFWHAMVLLKERGILDFDLGGVNDESAQGIKRFKEGMGGEFVRLAGFYR